MDRAVFMDASPLASRPLTGIGRYAARLALALSEAGRVRFFTGGYEVSPPDSLSWSQDQDLAPWARRVWTGRRTRLEPPPGAIGVYPGPREAVRRFDREVDVLYDFTPLLLPATHSARTRKSFPAYYAGGLLASDAVLAISEATRFDALWLTDVEPWRIAAEWPGPSLCIRRHLHPGPVRRDSRILLSVSTLEPRKNAPFLFEWFAKTQSLPPDAELLWVGPVGWLTSRRALRRHLRDSPRRIRFLGMVPDRELCRLYQSAGRTVYPSLYEGFGFPVLDSLRHGTPVLASGNSSLVEFRVPGVTFFDPCDPATLDEAWITSTIRADAPPPIGDLDRIYSWSRVADRVRILAEGGSSIVPEATGERAA